MRPHCVTRSFWMLAVLPLLTIARGEVATIFPANHATRVNPDTHLVLTFSSAPVLGKSGQIRIYDAADHRLVDTLDLSIPAGPDPSHRVTNPPVTAFVQDAASPTTTTPAVRTTPADLHDYQLTTIGGLADFHFYPVIIHGNVATIYPHNNMLRYGHEYIVQDRSGRSHSRFRRLRGLHYGERLAFHDQAGSASLPMQRASWLQPTAAAISTPSRAPSISFPTIHPSE